ncbi:MAG: pantetheine-phosphate adenylyltransferase [Clostridia bacterium]|nr:pantetheine-phosphate adenylyltransferase [Clostridia bacterium]
MSLTNIRRALVPGSFDPLTMGHYDLAVRAAAIFDEVHVVAFANAAKKGRFSEEERLAIMKASFAGIPNIRCEINYGLLADYCIVNHIQTIVKGARSATDFDYELSLSLINRSIAPRVDTIILPTRAEYLHISSTMVSEMIRYGHDYAPFVPKGGAEVLAEILARRKSDAKN